MKSGLLRVCSLTIFSLLITLTSCLKDKVEVTHIHYTDEDYAALQAASLDLPRELMSYQVVLPRHMTNNALRAPHISDAKATLGRVLFYDKKLSQNNTVSCASCHDQSIAFSDKVAFSEGFDGEVTKRNSLALGSVANFESSYGGGGSFVGQKAGFFWDERAHSIAQQSTMTIQDNIEMGMSMQVLPTKLSSEEYYKVLFRKAYGSESITSSRITDALQEFVNSIFSTQSPFDEGLNKHFNASTNFSNFSPKENLGKALFNQNCSSCHGSDMSSAVENIANNGLDAVYEDLGVGGVTNRPTDIGKFKVPFLRNIELTGPFMHDGRFETLEEVVAHYNEGIQMSDNLDFRLRNPENNEEPIRMGLDQEEQDALVAFLKTLTDRVFIQEEKYADPFMD